MSKCVTMALVFLLGGLPSAADEPTRSTETTAPPPTTESSGPAPGVAMNDFYLDRLLHGMTSEVEGGDGQWLFTWFDVEMILISDEDADRMRVITPVGDANELDAGKLRFLMEVNFERALDAKYAIWQDQVWATFVHPLSLLTPDELKSGVMQVVNLTRSYGTDFTSMGMSFTPAAPETTPDTPAEEP